LEVIMINALYLRRGCADPGTGLSISIAVGFRGVAPP